VALAVKLGREGQAVFISGYYYEAVLAVEE
jgi:hypothetical protein